MCSKNSPFMSIEEMRKHEWTINWSGGKDSTATIIACIKYGVPIKEINYVRMMYDDNLTATIPIMTEFVDMCSDFFNDVYGIKVNIIKSTPCVDYVCNKVYTRARRNKKLNGSPYTLACLNRLGCMFSKCKIEALRSIKKSRNEMIGYCIDEPQRYIRLKHPYQESILCTLGINQEKARYICSVNGLLSPLYDLGIKRDGCWFCPSASKREIEYLKKEHPDLVKIIYDDMDRRAGGYYPNTNTWVKEYMQDRGLLHEGS